MQNLSGHNEKQLLIREKISFELTTLPSIFSEYTRFLVDNRKSDTTIYAYLTTLTACFRTIFQDYYISNETFYKDITFSDLEYYFDAKDSLGTKALQRRWSVLNSFFSFLIEKNYLSTNPMQKIRRPIGRNTNRTLNYLTRDEFNRLIATIKHNPTKFTSFRDEVIIKLAVSTGLDITDIVNLNYDDINFVYSTIRVINKKGERIIPIGDSLLSLLKNWIQFRNQYFKEITSPALFVSFVKRRLSTYAAGEMLRNYCMQACIPQVTFKDLKSTMVYLLAKENVSMESIMEFLGVSDYLMIVQAYDAAMKEHDVSILNALNGLFDAPISLKQGEDDSATIQHNFSIEVKPPDYSQYTGGKAGFTIYVNILNQIDTPLKLKLKSCTIFMNGMLRTSDYVYSGYEFKEEYIFPNTTRTFGKIWITDEYVKKQLQPGEYLLLCLVEVDSKIEHHIKYVFNEGMFGASWIEENWYEVDSN